MSDSSMGTAEPPLLRTPLYETHKALGARLVEFGGWEMPVRYSGDIAEHQAVRQRAGLFDVCHMGEFFVSGRGALNFLQSLVPNNVARLTENQALYTQILRPDGGTIDDLIIYHRGPEQYMVVVNAGTMPKDWSWFTERAQGRTDVALENRSSATGLLALQGPLAQSILQPLTPAPLESIAYYHSLPGNVSGVECLISRTGYTGEDGFELYCDAGAVADLWSRLLEAGAPAGLLPAGLGARDTLRLEAAYCLYGHELTEEISPLEAGLGWTVKLDKGTEFVGRDALVAQKRDGLPRKLIGIELTERGVPRAGYPLMREGAQVGELTSGTMAPTLNKPIGLGYVTPDAAAVGMGLTVEIRGKPVAATVTQLPFYKRPKPAS
ncbi:MAG TPA: glycine cleavage system aminomethyltransferase GcvT [Ktedonobacterales bacterium]